MHCKTSTLAIVARIVRLGIQIKKAESPLGNPAIYLRPVAFRPYLAISLALSKIILKNT